MIAGQATFSGCLAVVPVEQPTLQSWLPPSISLPQCGDAACPCLLAFGEQAHGATFFGGFTVPWGVRYHEFMVAIPFARSERVSGEFLFVLGMVCDFWPAVWSGNSYYGFSKRFAPMSWDGARFLVKDDRGEVDFCGAVDAANQTSEVALDWIRAAAALPVLGARRDGAFVRSRFEWDFRDATVEPTALHLTVSEGFDELPLGRKLAHNGAYRVEGMKWRLGWPASAP
jgi:hypothetical protein